MSRDQRARRSMREGCPRQESKLRPFACLMLGLPRVIRHVAGSRIRLCQGFWAVCYSPGITSGQWCLGSKWGAKSGLSGRSRPARGERRGLPCHPRSHVRGRPGRSSPDRSARAGRRYARSAHRPRATAWPQSVEKCESRTKSVPPRREPDGSQRCCCLGPTFARRRPVAPALRRSVRPFSFLPDRASSRSRSQTGRLTQAADLGECPVPRAPPSTGTGVRVAPSANRVTAHGRAWTASVEELATWWHDKSKRRPQRRTERLAPSPRGDTRPETAGWLSCAETAVVLVHVPRLSAVVDDPVPQ